MSLCSMLATFSTKLAKVTEMIPFPYEILEGATLKGESPYWLVTYQGFQLGGDIDSSGAGNLTFSSYDEAFDYVTTTLN